MALSRYRSPARDDGSPGFAGWVRALRSASASGVYVIRDARTGRTIYVGQSSTGRLYGTLTRHFQRWDPSYWTDGATYDRAQVLVAIEETHPDDARPRERALLRRLCPRDNVDKPECDDVPF